MLEERPAFWKWIIFSDGLIGKVWGSIDRIREDAPEDMKEEFWKWIQWHKDMDMQESML